jgi:type IV secretory pathway TrbD component
VSAVSWRGVVVLGTGVMATVVALVLRDWQPLAVGVGLMALFSVIGADIPSPYRDMDPQAADDLRPDRSERCGGSEKE